ncbi:MAG UNVERIFIED_CONTAM: hypothetical protein LVR18_38565 [Planctomycetaceae bacterium]
MGRPPDVISLPRQLVSLRLLSFPVVAAAELGELIALQLESRQAGPDAAQIWDFLPHPTDAADTQQHVSLLSAPRGSARVSAAPLKPPAGNFRC